ncbi:MAG: helix-turn-helix domain-containing protein [Eubacteriales bacterium]|nr:helix-turn-helix domain-containing protein [Eubacteriales bacterium]
MDTIDVLRQLGFSPNEAKVYIALVKHSPQNGYEIAKSSGITRTMIYDILARLVQKGFVLRIESEPTLYCAVNRKDLIEKLRTEHNRKVTHLDHLLSNLSTINEDEYYVFNWRGGERQLIDQLNLQIKIAKESIYLSIWDIEAEMIRDELEKAYNRGVKIFIFSFCKMPFSFGTQCSYEIKDLEVGDLDRFQRRRVVAVFDKNKMIVSTGDTTVEDVSILTGNPVLIGVAIDLIILDLLLLQNIKKFGGYVPGAAAEDYEHCITEFLKRLDLPSNLPSTNA